MGNDDVKWKYLPVFFSFCCSFDWIVEWLTAGDGDGAVVVVAAPAAAVVATATAIAATAAKMNTK